MKRSRRKKVSPIEYPKMTVEEFETFSCICLDDMIKADRCVAATPGFGAKTFAAAGLRDEGFGILVRLKSKETFILKIVKVDQPESKEGQN